MATDGERRLDREEAEQLLDLMNRVEADMEEAFKEAADGTFGDGDTATFEERWGESPGTMYTLYTRRKYRQFIETVYLDDVETSD